MTSSESNPSLPTRRELEATINHYKGNTEQTEMLNKEFTKLLYTHYINLITAGFTKEQAFELLCRRGIS